MELASTASGRRQAVELGEHRALHLEILGRVLLDVVGTRQRAPRGSRDRCMRAQHVGGGGAVEQILRGEIGQERRRCRPAPPRRRPGSGPTGATSWPARAKAMAQARPIEAGADDGDLLCVMLGHPASQRLDIAVDAERLARDVAAQRREQEQHHRRHVLRPSPCGAARPSRDTAAPSPHR